MTPAARVTGPSRWRASPRTLLRLLVGLWLFGTGEALIVAAELGNGPWTVFAQGLASRTALTIGQVTILVGVAVLLGWVPLRERPGLGTLCNVVVIGLAIDAMLPLAPDGLGLVGRWLYLSAQLGSG